MSKTLLVIDDNPANLKLASYVLARRGYEIRTARDANEALAALENFRPALILLDLQLPGMDGFELARRLKGRDDVCRIPIVAVTAYAMSGDRERALAAGCDAYVRKPIDKEELRRVVAAEIERAGSSG